MVDGAVTLLATRGVEGTSFAEVLERSGSPRGSVYHHFPGGKAELLDAALRRVSDRGLAAMEEVRGEPAPVVLDRFLDLWRQLLDRSHLRAGCAVVAVTVAPPSDELHDRAGAIFRTWTEQLTDLFATGGMSRPSAERLSALAIAATEGAVVVARAQRSRDAFDRVAGALMELARTSV